jgi:uncharacterized membrane protein YphA (DoxX/SURF4 family)
MNTKIWIVKVTARVALGLVWLYEGLVPKILFLRADEIELVKNSGLTWRTPELTLLLMGVAQMLVGLWLIVGCAERLAVAVATVWMLVLIMLVAGGNPGMLTDPYGALVKDFCLLACPDRGRTPKRWTRSRFSSTHYPVSFVDICARHCRQRRPLTN